jgi:hypothetical protein
MSKPASDTEAKGLHRLTSTIVPVGDTIDLDNIDAANPHYFAGLEFFADSHGDTPATPSAGTVTITARSINSPNYMQNPSGSTGVNVIDLTAYEDLAFEGNYQAVRVIPSGIVGATHYRLNVSCNKT